METPPASSYVAQQTMRANRRRDTAAELAVRRLLHRAGTRYRVDYPPDPTDRRKKADIVFTRAKIAVFIDGCFWHGCPQHYVEPKLNAEYWVPKIAGTRMRDAATTEQLTELGWTVMRFWEHEDPIVIADHILRAVRPAGAQVPPAPMTPDPRLGTDGGGDASTPS